MILSPSSLNDIPGLPKGFVNIADTRSNFYAFHGIGLCLSSNEPVVLESLAPSLKHFRCEKSALPAKYIRLSFFSCDDLTKAPFAPPAQAKEVSFSGELKYFSDENQIFTTLSDKAQVLHKLDENWATGFIDKKLLQDTWAIKQHLFYPPFAELLKQNGLFNVHGALAANDKGQAILITAPTGGGKSTTLVNLIRAGYKFLSDDISLVRREGSELLMLSFPEPVNLTPHAVENFPELAFLKNTPKPCPSRKHSFAIEDSYKDCLGDTAIPGWIVFPQVQAEGVTKLVPIPKREALSLLIPQSVIVANKAIVREHLDILTQLVQQCPCFRLLLGKGAQEEVPKLFATLK